MSRGFKRLFVAVAAALLALGLCSLLFGWGLGTSERKARYRLLGYWSPPADQLFDQPYAVGVDPRNGNVLVTDAQNQRVVVFNRSGILVRQFGRKGSGPGEFALPSGVAVGVDGSIYVADYMQDRVQKFSETGAFILQWGNTGSGPRQFRNPGGLAADKDGHVYVADIFNHRISEFDSQGKFVGSLGRHGQWRLGDFDYPSDVAVADNGRLLVADTYNYRVQLLDPDGGARAAWGWHLFWLWPRPNDGDKGFGEATSAAFGADVIHVADSKNRRLVMLDAHGHFVTGWKVPGATGKAQTPIQVALSPDGKTVYTTDIANNRLAVLGVEQTNASSNDVKENQLENK